MRRQSCSLHMSRPVLNGKEMQELDLVSGMHLCSLARGLRIWKFLKVVVAPGTATQLMFAEAAVSRYHAASCPQCNCYLLSLHPAPAT
jgi:hypothetical protein